MAPFVAESVPHRARLAWLAGALVASIVAVVGLRSSGPAPAKTELSPRAIGHCGGSRFVRVDVVPSYHHEVTK